MATTFSDAAASGLVQDFHEDSSFFQEITELCQKTDELIAAGLLDRAGSTLKACVDKLAFLRLHNPEKTQQRFFDRIVIPYIGAHARAPQRLSNTAVNLDHNKALLTFASCDRALWLVANGSEEDLSMFVEDPQTFISKRKETVIVVVDETALWLKLRGEEKVYYSDAERLSEREGQALKRKRDAAALQDFHRQTENQNTKSQVDAVYSSAGDKFRVTQVTISAVKHWFDVDRVPVCHKPRQVLIAPCKEHCRLSDQTADGTWAQSVSYENADGTMTFLKKGTSCVGHLDGYRAARDNYADATWNVGWEVMGQPKAWVDKQIAVFISDHIAKEYDQCLIFCDALGSRWSEPSTLRHWSNQQILIPYASAVTPFLSQPDTHFHRHLKSQYKKVKGKLTGNSSILRVSRSQGERAAGQRSSRRGCGSEICWG